MDLKTVIDSAPTLKKPRRTFTAEFKHQLIQQCQQPDTSVARVAMQHQINANLLHKWIRQFRLMPSALTTPSSIQVDFLPIVLLSPPVKDFFIRMTDAQRHLFANKMSEMPEMGKYSQGTESYQQFAIRITDMLLEPEKFRELYPILEKSGFQP